ncbi:hypothetical protein DASB73_009080 [Starmerella bacillaris]|uniref:Uncharacterized protein n=1 Tax=Starmerella bacillaris TaxID=1247836 RepID=A0AAV5RF09_STABA|nr:hypothetical protein DASB73_009080 [Starmerella bacillaris]
MSQLDFSVADLARPFKELKKDSRIIKLHSDELSSLESPNIYIPVNAKDRSLCTFDKHWKHVRVRFSKENREKVQLLWNTRFGTLALDNIRSDHDLTLREELSTRFVYTPEEAKIGRALSKYDSECKRVANDSVYHEKRKAKDKKRYHAKRAQLRMEASKLGDTTVPEEPGIVVTSTDTNEPHNEEPGTVVTSTDTNEPHNEEPGIVVTSTDINESHNEGQALDSESLATSGTGNEETDI